MKVLLAFKRKIYQNRFRSSFTFIANLVNLLPKQRPIDHYGNVINSELSSRGQAIYKLGKVSLHTKIVFYFVEVPATSEFLSSINVCIVCIYAKASLKQLSL
jgi:hypothetical protein